MQLRFVITTGIIEEGECEFFTDYIIATHAPCRCGIRPSHSPRNVATFSLNVLPLQHAPLAACAPIVSCMLDTAIQHAPKCLVGQTNAHVSCNRHAMVTLSRKATRASKAEANSRAHAYTPSTHQKGGMTCVRWHMKRLWPSA